MDRLLINRARRQTMTGTSGEAEFRWRRMSGRMFEAADFWESSLSVS
jgi:hypothetical protein